MAYGEYVTLEGVEIGEDSDSGLAFSCLINMTQYWVPYSQTKALHRNRAAKNASSIEVTLWWVEKNEIET